MKGYLSVPLLMTPETVLVFDLDDTLYKEITYVESGFRAVLESIDLCIDITSVLSWMIDGMRDGGMPLDRLAQRYDNLEVRGLLDVYRDHRPLIELEPGSMQLLELSRSIGLGCGLVTDGRSKGQRQKLRALGIASLFDVVVISEEIGTSKPSVNNFALVEQSFSPDARFIYIADNPRKDFVTPNRMGWHTVQVDDDGRNIHQSQSMSWPDSYEAIERTPDLVSLIG